MQPSGSFGLSLVVGTVAVVLLAIAAYTGCSRSASHRAKAPKTPQRAKKTPSVISRRGHTD